MKKSILPLLLIGAAAFAFARRQTGKVETEQGTVETFSTPEQGINALNRAVESGLTLKRTSQRAGDVLAGLKVSGQFGDFITDGRNSEIVRFSDKPDQLFFVGVRKPQTDSGLSGPLDAMWKRSGLSLGDFKQSRGIQ